MVTLQTVGMGSLFCFDEFQQDYLAAQSELFCFFYDAAIKQALQEVSDRLRLRQKVGIFFIIIDFSGMFTDEPPVFHVFTCLFLDHSDVLRVHFRRN